MATTKKQQTKRGQWWERFLRSPGQGRAGKWHWWLFSHSIAWKLQLQPEKARGAAAKKPKGDPRLLAGTTGTSPPDRQARSCILERLFTRSKFLRTQPAHPQHPGVLYSHQYGCSRDWGRARAAPWHCSKGPHPPAELVSWWHSNGTFLETSLRAMGRARGSGILILTCSSRVPLTPTWMKRCLWLQQEKPWHQQNRDGARQASACSTREPSEPQHSWDPLPFHHRCPSWAPHRDNPGNTLLSWCLSKTFWLTAPACPRSRCWLWLWSRWRWLCRCLWRYCPHSVEKV